MCAQDSICTWLYQKTNWGWIQDGYFLLANPVRIALIAVLAIIARSMINHAINKVVDRTSDGKLPGFLRPLKARLPSASLFPERRGQRAAAIGSLLKSFVTVIVFTIAFLMVLDLFGFNLAPVLTSLGVVGIALGFGAQTLVKDLIAGLFMLLEDQYGVGDVIDTGEAVGVVESVGLRVVTIRDARGVLWYVRNGEIIRVGNKSQGWAQLLIDIPIGFAPVEEATRVLREAVAVYADDPEHAGEFLEPPALLGIEQLTVDGAVIRVTCKTASDKQLDVQRELRRRLMEALEGSGIAAQIQAYRLARPPMQQDGGAQP